MSWLIIAIFSYFILAIVSLGDKYLLSGPPNPKVYSFYVGILGSLTFLIIPFVDFSFSDLRGTFLALMSGVFSIFSLYFLFKGLEKFEASRIVPSIGGLVPLFTFLLLLFVSRGQEGLESTVFAAFIFLVLGSVIITYNKKLKISLDSFIISSISALFFALHFVSSKYVYLDQPFWNGFITMRIGALFIALLFIFSKSVRKELFSGGDSSFDKKTGTIFLLNQTGGAGAYILQHFAIYLAGVSYVSIIMALSGIQYAFLFIFALLLSSKMPFVIREEINKEIILQKTLAIILIMLGLVLINLNININV